MRSHLRSFAVLSAVVLEFSSWQPQDSPLHRVFRVRVDDATSVEVLDWGGSGPPLILLAGLGDTPHSFDEWAPRFRDIRRVIGVTRRGYGGSTPLSGSPTMERLAEDVRTVMDSLQVATADLAGHSLGSDEVTMLAALHPERVRSVVFLDGAYDRTSLGTAMRGAPPPAFPVASRADSASLVAMNSFLAQTRPRAPMGEMQALYRTDADGRVAALRTPESVDATIVRAIVRPPFGRVRAPALAIYSVTDSLWQQLPFTRTLSSADRVIADRHQATFAEWLAGARAAFRRDLPGAEVVELRGAHHYLFASHPDTTERLIRDFLSRGGRRPGQGLSERYRKSEVRIPMRDGVELFTAIFAPRDTSRRYPILIARTPYSIAPYGPDAFRTGLGPSDNPRYADDGFIFVYQDVRGRNRSGGTFTETTPHRSRKSGPADVDESTDSFDTIDWLVKNVPGNTGRAAIWGISYPGFYALASCIDPHPALVACSPQAPIVDIANGDDLFHNGAFLLAHNLGFYLGFGRTPRDPSTGTDAKYPVPSLGRDAYNFFLGLGPIAQGTRDWLPAATAPRWKLLLDHPNYDEYWRARDIAQHLRRLAPAVLIVGGLYDAEDLSGTYRAYEAAQRLATGSDVRLVMGPWSHGGWWSGAGDRLGSLRWTSVTGPFYRDSVEYPFFLHHLKGGPAPELPEALVFRSGADRWDRYPSWPPSGLTRRAFYLAPTGKLTYEPPPAASGYSEYVSDPRTPVPVIEGIEPRGMPREYMTADQRFASRRPDVLTFGTSTLERDITLSGPVSVTLHVATTGTDADFVVKLIDVFPDDAPRWAGDSSGFEVAGYQQMVRGEVIRGRARRDPARPLPFTPARPDSVRLTLPAINHTFRRGHRIMVQVQSSWFPHIDLNPQTFVPNIFRAQPGDFVKATMRVYHDAARPSRIEVGVIRD